VFLFFPSPDLSLVLYRAVYFVNVSALTVLFFFSPPSLPWLFLNFRSLFNLAALVFKKHHLFFFLCVPRGTLFSLPPRLFRHRFVLCSFFTSSFPYFFSRFFYVFIFQRTSGPLAPSLLYINGIFFYLRPFGKISKSFPI